MCACSSLQPGTCPCMLLLHGPCQSHNTSAAKTMSGGQLLSASVSELAGVATNGSHDTATHVSIRSHILKDPCPDLQQQSGNPPWLTYPVRPAAQSTQTLLLLNND
jgi:hypothetical protein